VVHVQQVQKIGGIGRGIFIWKPGRIWRLNLKLNSRICWNLHLPLLACTDQSIVFTSLSSF